MKRLDYKKGKTIITIGLLAAMMIGTLGALTGCGSSSAQLLTGKAVESDQPPVYEKGDLIEVEDAAEPTWEDEEAFYQHMADFSLELFQKSIEEKKSSMISPTSVLMAMTMVENGAVGNTLDEMVDTLGSGACLGEQDEALNDWYQALPSTKNAKLDIANSIWFRDDKDAIEVENSFLNRNQDYFQAQVYKAPFDDSTVDDINGWVKKNTDGMIGKIVNEIPNDVVLYLINAVAFDAKWMDAYTDEQVSEDDFTNAAGEVKQVDMMYSEEHQYIETKDATGFIKPYEEGYSFVALLPKKGTTVEDYVATLDGEKFLDGIENVEYCDVDTMLPKFESEYAIKMNDILQDMGIKAAFDPSQADFGNLGTTKGAPLYISDVLHKTYILVDEQGTKAAAVTAVTMETGSAMVEEPKRVYLDRPFVYAIIDNESNLPIFIGTVQDIE